MTRLYINGEEVSLMQDFECDFYTRNPFFTKDGDFTYDIDVDLRDARSRHIYSYINRSDVTHRPEGRKAVLISDANVIVSGKEIVLSVDSDIAKIQIVSDNSELNYLYTGKQTLRQLNIGSMVRQTYEENNLDYYYPRVDHVCCTVCANIGTGDRNPWLDQKTAVLYNDHENDTSNGVKFKRDSDIVLQPFLLTCIEKVINALGYQMGENVLAHDEFACRLIVVNGLHTEDLSKILPNWEVSEFITEVEKFFNVIFLLNSKLNTVSIVSLRDFYKTNDVTEIPSDDVLDDNEVVFDQSESLYISYNNVSYKLGSSTWYKYQSLEDELKAKCNRKVLPFADIVKTVLRDYPWTIFEESSKHCDIVKTMFHNDEFNSYEIVDELRPLVDEKSENNCELKIIPAETIGRLGNIKKLVAGGNRAYEGWLTSIIPVVANVKRNEEQQFAYKAIENGVTMVEDTVDSNIYVSLYLGLVPYMYAPDRDSRDNDIQPGITKYRAPMAIAQPYHVCWSFIGRNATLYQLSKSDMTLSIVHGMSDRYYKGNIQVDTKTERVFRFKSNKILDPKNIFLIRNKRYYCKELHYLVRADGLDPIVEGTFYLL